MHSMCSTGSFFSYDSYKNKGAVMHKLDVVVKSYMNNWVECAYCCHMINTDKHIVTREYTGHNMCSECADDHFIW